MDIELHIITNCIKSVPDTRFIARAWQSFVNTFGEITPVVWCDPTPRPELFEAYCRNIRAAGMPVVLRSAGLADAYLKILEKTTADFLFVLEHDWVFDGDHIHHSLAEICEVMEAERLAYMRFFLIPNRVQGMTRTLTEHDADGFKYCLSNCWSGNPHVLNRRECERLDIAARVRHRGNKTLERHLTNDPELSGAIYGPKNHPPTIIHTDGREGEPKPFWDEDKIRRVYESQQAPRAVPGSDMEIDLGIVVPACLLPDQAFLKRRFLASIKKDARPQIKYEVLFVTPDRFDIYTRDGGRDMFNIAKAYNAGLAYFRKRARFIACADIDLLFPPNFLDHTVRRAAVKPHCARVRLVDPGQIKPRQWTAWKKLPPRPGTGAWNCMSYADYFKVGGFCAAMYGWGGVDTDFKQRQKETFGQDGIYYDDEYPLMHINHPDRDIVAPRRPGQNMAIANYYRKLKMNWLTNTPGVLCEKRLTQ